MKLSNLVEERGMIARLSKETGVSAPNISYRARQGWCVGKLDGKMVMYNPAHVTSICSIHEEAFNDWNVLQQGKPRGEQ